MHSNLIKIVAEYPYRKLFFNPEWGFRNKGKNTFLLYMNFRFLFSGKFNPAHFPYNLRKK